MRISSTKSARKIQLSPKVILALGLVVLVVIAFSLYPRKSTDSEVYFCDMERTVGTKFKGTQGLFTNARNQSKNRARSGSYSARCGPDVKYGPGFDLKNVNSGDVFVASVWRFSEEAVGSLVFAGDWGLYKNSAKVKTRKNGWDLIEIKVRIPIGVNNETLKVYVYTNSKSGAVYFDDFKIVRTKNSFKPPKESTFKEEQINLILEEKEMERLQAKRIDAFAYGNLIASSADFVQGKLKTKEGEMLVNARLKGDLLDHLQGKKWSFRLVPEKGSSWNNFKEFSVQNAASRAFMDEWLFHKVLEREGLMTTRYDFIKFALNDEILGIYAYEEHFANPILNNHGRNPGPIFRISEDGLWSNTQKGLNDELRWYESAQIEPFDKKEVLKSKRLFAMYEQGQNMLYGFLKGEKTVAEVFDIEKFGKYLAIVDLCRANHSTNSTNLRFYYNPATAKLEPIGYDGYSDEGRKWLKPPMIFGKENNSNIPLVDFAKRDQEFYFYLLNDYDFMAVYAKYLDRFSAEDYVQLLQDTLYPEVIAREGFIQEEYVNYKFDLQEYFANGAGIRNILYPIPDISLKAYYKERSSKNSILTLQGFHYMPLEIVGVGDKEIEYKPKTKLIVEAFNPKYVGPEIEWTVPGKFKKLFFKTLGTDSLASIDIFRWKAPTSTPKQASASIENLERLDFISVNEKEKLILIKSGDHLLRTDLKIPSGYTVKIAAGTRLNLKNNTAIISNSPIFAIGTNEKPIFITSEDKMGAGLAVLQTKEASVFEKVVFSQLNSINKNGHFLDGGVNFYEADAKFTNCRFANIKGKDGLSISRSSYKITNSSFENCSGDGLDANFAVGRVDDCQFKNIGKDAIEISGGKMEASQIEINKSLRTGLSGNLGAKISVYSLKIEDAERGVSSIDAGEIELTKLELKEIQQGLVIYKNLAEYKVGKITAKNYSAENVDKLHSIEAGGELLLKGKLIRE